MAKRWKKQDITYLKRYAKIRLLEELAKRFKTDTETVSAKLEELGLAAKDSVVKLRLEHDPLVKVYERGLKALHRSRWREAKKLFEKVLAETDQPELAERTRRQLAVCRRQLKKAPAAASQDPFLLAVYERNRGNLDAALEICARGGRQSKDERFAYLAASLHAAMGELEKAGRFLSRAIELNPKNRVHAYHDADFAALRQDPEHASLFEIP